jgi:hypothetical protein
MIFNNERIDCIRGIVLEGIQEEKEKASDSLTVNSLRSE